jgi:N-acyl-phosphatidylethanolamine-hydrolysing phospholipase D
MMHACLLFIVWQNLTDLATMMYQVNIRAPPEPISTTAATIPIHTPDFSHSSSGFGGKSIPADQIKATWLGHACFLLELPSTTPGRRGIRLLLDPVFSDRCSPSAWVGPKRFTKVPCQVEDLPEIDAVVSQEMSDCEIDAQPGVGFSSDHLP